MTPGDAVSTLLDGAAMMVEDAFRAGRTVSLDAALAVALTNSGVDSTDPAAALLLADAAVFIRMEVLRAIDESYTVAEWAALPTTGAVEMVDVLRRAAARARFEE